MRTKVTAQKHKHQAAKPNPSPRKSQKQYFRSNIKAVVDFFHEIQLEERHFQVLKETPFWLLIEACKKMNSSTCKKKDDFIEMLIQSYRGKGYFTIGGKNIKLVKEDVKLIFGIQCGEEEMNTLYASKQQIDFVKRRNLRDGKLTALSIKGLIKKIVKSKKEVDVEDVARMICMFLCLSLFFPTSGSTLSWANVSYLDNLKAMKCYDWANAIYKTLLGSIEQHRKAPRKVTGCVTLLLYWFCEHVQVMVRPESPTPCATIPRLAKWDITEMHKQLGETQLKDIETNKVYAFPLKPTQAECELYEISSIDGVHQEEEEDEEVDEEADEEEDGEEDDEEQGSSEEEEKSHEEEEENDEEEEHEEHDEEDEEEKTGHHSQPEIRLADTPGGTSEAFARFDTEDVHISPYYSQFNSIVPETPDQPMVLQLQLLLKKEKCKVEELQNEKQLIEDELSILKSDKADGWIVNQFLKKMESTSKTKEEVHLKQVEEMKRVKKESDEVYSLEIEKLKKERDEALSHVEAFEKVIEDITFERDNHLKEKEELEKNVEDFKVQLDTDLETFECLLEDKDAYILTLTTKIEILQKQNHVVEKVNGHLMEKNEKLKEEIDAHVAHNMTQEYRDEQEREVHQVTQMATFDKIKQLEKEKQELEEKMKQLDKEKQELEEQLQDMAAHELTQKHSAMKRYPSPGSRVKRVKERLDRRENMSKDFVYMGLKRKSPPIEREHIDVDHYQSEEPNPNAKKKQMKLKTLNRKSVVQNLIDDQVWTTIEKYWDDGNPGTVVWTSPQHLKLKNHVVVADIQHLLFEESISNQCLDAYTQLLMEQNKEEVPTFELATPPNKSFIFNSYLRDILNGKDEDHLNKTLGNLMPQSVEARFLIFPILLDSHWTLLILDKVEGKWKFYNSLRRKNQKKDKFCNATDHLRKVIAAYINNNARGMGQRTIFDTVEIPKHSPQQKTASLDCGIVVISIIKNYLMNEETKSKISEEECRDIRADMVHEFLETSKTS